MLFLSPTHFIRKKVKDLSDRLQDRYGLTTLTAVEQELRTTPLHPIDVNAFKEQMRKDAGERLKTAPTDEEKLRARHVLEALPQAKTAEHLFNIAVYDKMHSDLEFRGTPAIHGAGYYDMPGNIEFRTLPLFPPTKTATVYAHLLDTILKEAKHFGLKVKWRGEQLNMSVWRGDENITSVAGGADKDLAARILMGMLETNEDVRPLMPRQLGGFGKAVSGGPTRLDAIRIVNHSPDVRQHRFEQRDDFRYDIMLNVSHRLLMMLDGTLRGLEHPEYARRVTPIRAVYFTPKNRDHITRVRLDETFRILTRLELDGNGHAVNIDDVFSREDTLFKHGRMGALITKELTGKSDPLSELRVKKFLRAVRFADNAIQLPQEPPDFKGMSAKIASMNVTASVHDSLKFSGILVPDKEDAERRVAGLRERWGEDIVTSLATTLQKNYQRGTHADQVTQQSAERAKQVAGAKR